MLSNKLVLCTDLDRTLLPNGDYPEPANARAHFTRLVQHPDILLVYVSGRDRKLMTEAISEYQLPQPHFAVTDVGATIYQVSGAGWQPLQSWQDRIAADWQGMDSWQIREHMAITGPLQLQPESKQAPYKLSYELHPTDKLTQSVNLLKQHLENLAINYNCIVSIDETKDLGLVDILPNSADKRLALDFISQTLDISSENFVFSGDSGNDLAVLLSPIKATLVGNATPEVKQQASAELATHHGHTLYFAEQYYAAGIIEGFIHYFPAMEHWLNRENNND